VYTTATTLEACVHTAGRPYYNRNCNTAPCQGPAPQSRSSPGQGFTTAMYSNQVHKFALIQLAVQQLHNDCLSRSTHHSDTHTLAHSCQQATKVSETAAPVTHLSNAPMQVSSGCHRPAPQMLVQHKRNMLTPNSSTCHVGTSKKMCTAQWHA
jgi:hypothetical protein